MVQQRRRYWEFESHALYGERTTILDWDKFGFDGIESLSARTAFRGSCKAFATAFFSDISNHLGDHPSPGTLANKARAVRRLVRWMIAAKKYSFSDLRTQDLLDYVVLWHNESRGGLKQKSLRLYLQLFEKLWDLRFHYSNALTFDPRYVAKLYDLHDAAERGQPWKPVPVDSAVCLVTDAMAWIENGGEGVIEVFSKRAQLRGSLIGLTKKQMRQRTHEADSNIEKLKIYKLLCTKLYHTSTPPPSREVYRKLIRQSYGAAITILLFFSGMRCSEMLSLTMGCYDLRTHKSGENFWYLTGVQAKSGGRTREWIVPPPLISAVRFLEQLHITLLGDLQDVSLFSLPDGNGVLPPPYVNVRRIWQATVRTLLQEFSAGPLRTGLCLPDIHPHQARKTFARFVVMRDKHALEALAQHYGHLYEGLLDRSYVGFDIQLHQLLEQEAEAELERGLTELITSEALGGKAGQAMATLRENAQLHYRGKLSISSLIKKLMREGVVLAPCDWGYCVYAQDRSACQGDARGPNPILREPNTCATCSNFAVTETHRSWWEERSRREQAFVASSGPCQQAKAITLLRMERTKRVLSSLNRDGAHSNGKTHQ